MYKLLLFIFFLCSFSNNVFAYKGDFYAGVNTGSVFFPNDPTITFASDSKKVKNGNFVANFENKMFSIEGSIGYDFANMFMGEIVGSFVKTTVNSPFIEAIMPTQSQFDQPSNFGCAFIDATIKIDNTGNLIPFFGVGGGIVSMSLFSYSALGFGYQILGGLDIAITGSFYLSANYRYIDVFKETFNVSVVGYLDGDDNTLKLEGVDGNFIIDGLSSHVVTLGVKFVF